LLGPGGADRQSSGAMMADESMEGCGAARATRVSGAARSVTVPESHRYACRETVNRRSPSQPPRYVPTNPVTTTIAPNCTVAWALGMPRTRSKKVGVQNANAPIANVYAA